MRLDKIRANKESGENMYLLSGNPKMKNNPLKQKSENMRKNGKISKKLGMS